MCENEIKNISVEELDTACPIGIHSPINSVEAFELSGR